MVRVARRLLVGSHGGKLAELRKLPNVHYIDVEADTRVGEHRKWFRDCSYDPSDSALYGACDAPLAASTFRFEPLIARVLASRTGAGVREVVAELSLTPE